MRHQRRDEQVRVDPLDMEQIVSGGLTPVRQPVRGKASANAGELPSDLAAASETLRQLGEMDRGTAAFREIVPPHGT